MDGQTFREMIVQSTAAKRMIGTVSPIYEDAYAGCWLFEDIGREWDRIWEIIDQLPDQLFPQTATWLLGLWERRYGITPNIDDTIDVRRQRIEEIEAYPKPFTPWTLDRWVYITCGRNVTVEDNIASYTFAVYVSTHPDSGPLNIETIKKYINRHKHSHMSYMLTFQSEEAIKIGIETSYWRFLYTMCGTLPQRNVPGGITRSEIVIAPEARGYPFDYEFSGTADAGELPMRNNPFGGGDSTVIIGPDGTPYPFGYWFAGDEEAGTLPGINITSGTEKRSIKAETSGEEFKMSYVPCGVINAGTGTL